MVAAIQAQGVNYRPGMQMGAQDRVSPEQLNHPGLYSLDQVVMKEAGIEPPKKHHGFRNFILSALVLTTAAVGLRKGVFNNIKGIDSVEEGVKTLIKPEKDANAIEKVKYYYAKGSDAIYDNTVGKIIKMCKKSEGEDGEEISGEEFNEATSGNNVDLEA
jgi:hypothetical protein